MLTQNQLASFLVFDLETVPTYSSYQQMRADDPDLAQQWLKRCDFYWRKYDGYENMDENELFRERAALEPEFLKIVAGSFATIKPDDNDESHDWKYSLVNIYSDDENALLDHCIRVIEYVQKQFKNPILFGHNISEFDIPVIGRRIIINKGVKELPAILRVANKKPWEIQMMELNSIWSFASFKNKFTTLELICHSLGIESPKVETEAKQVGEIYYNDNDLYRIAKYCGEDVRATSEAAAKLAGVNINLEQSETKFIEK